MDCRRPTSGCTLIRSAAPEARDPPKVPNRLSMSTPRHQGRRATSLSGQEPTRRCAAPGAGSPDADDAAVLQAAWECLYLDPSRCRELGLQLCARGERWEAHGHVIVASVEVRVGDLAAVPDRLAQAHVALRRHPDPRLTGLADEAEAIRLRRIGCLDEADVLLAQIDARPDPGWLPLDRFLRLNSRALQHKAAGRNDEALRQLHAAHDAALDSGQVSARVTALTNLGNFHWVLYNLEDARVFCEQGLALARGAGARILASLNAMTLVAVHHAAGRHGEAAAMAEWIGSGDPQLLPADSELHRIPRALGHLSAGAFAAAHDLLGAGPPAAAQLDDALLCWAWAKARCLFELGQVEAARDLALDVIGREPGAGAWESSSSMLELLRIAALACECIGDLAAALRLERRSQRVYEALVGRASRARQVALQAGQDLLQAQRERDLATAARRQAEADQARLAELNAALQAKVTEAEALHRRLSELVLRDPLTGLHNRRHLFESGPVLLAQAHRQGHPLSVVVLDLDHFKRLNDTHGHDAGDAELRRFADAMTRTMRPGDLVCRHGGEEFAVLLPGLGPEQAHAVVDRLQRVVRGARRPQAGPSSRRCTFSAGIATFPLHGRDLRSLLTRADRALYRAKQFGRARAECEPQDGTGGDPDR